MILFDVNVLLSAIAAGRSITWWRVNCWRRSRAGSLRRVRGRGALIGDAQHAALAIDHGCEWISFDRDFAKFPDLRWRHPLD